MRWKLDEKTQKNNKTVKRILAVVIALVIAGISFAAGFFTRKLTQGGELSSYEWFLNTVDEHYYYGGADQSFTQSGLKEIADKYLDRYSKYYTAEEYENTVKSNAGSKSGIGITYTYVQNKGVYISSVVGNSPAYISGLRAGEWLESGSVEGGKTVTFNASSDFSGLVYSADDGDEIRLTSTGGKSYTMAKAEYTASYAYMCTNGTSWYFGDAETGGLALYENSLGKISCLPDGAAYIGLSQFYGTAAKEFYKLIEKFNALHCTSLIIDLRSNGGGYVSVMQDIAGSFAGGEQKLAMLSRDKHGNTEKFMCAKITQSAYRVPENTEVYVMANSGTASASEALIGALICYGVLGYKNIFLSDYSEEYMDWLKSSGQELKTCQTYGKGIMQSTFVNGSTKEALKLTTARIYWPDEKTCIHDRGITLSDGCIPLTAEWEHTLADGELQAATEIIKSRH